ncbi:MAG: mannosyltransferase family protein [Candidatus Dormibacteria bacterium]
MAEPAPATMRPAMAVEDTGNEGIDRRTAWRMVGLPLLASKVLSLAVALVTASFVRADSVPFWSAARTAFVHWDAIHYLDIARRGYAGSLDFHQAFLPGFPALTAAVTVLTRDDVVAALLLNLAAESVALYYIARLVMAERDAAAARFAVWCVALGPIAFFLSAVYPESLLIAAAAAALYHSRRGNHLAAALAAALACSIRLTGLALVPALLFEYLRQRRGRLKPDVIAILAAPLPLILYAAYLQVHAGDWLAFLHAQSLPEFNHHLSWPWNGFMVTWDTLVAADGEVQSVFLREVGFAFLGLAACGVAWWWPRFPRMLALYCTLIWLMATSLSFWRSVPRYDLALFPIVLVLADATRASPRLRPALLGAAATIMAWGSWTFARGHWLG